MAHLPRQQKKPKHFQHNQYFLIQFNAIDFYYKFSACFVINLLLINVISLTSSYWTNVPMFCSQSAFHLQNVPIPPRNGIALSRQMKGKNSSYVVWQQGNIRTKWAYSHGKVNGTNVKYKAVPQITLNFLLILQNQEQLSASLHVTESIHGKTFPLQLLKCLLNK